MIRTKTNERIEWIDIAKGLGIILVILGHSTGGGVTMGIIYSFHMPMFFALSGLCLKYSSSFEELKNETVKHFHRLLFPYFILLICLFPYYTNNGDNFFDKALNNDISILWYMLVLFLSEWLYDVAHLIIKNLYFYPLVILFSITGTALGILGVRLPFMLDIVFSVMIWYVLAKADTLAPQSSLLRMSIALALWATALLIQFFRYGHMFNYYDRVYPGVALWFVVSILGTIAFFEGCSLIQGSAIGKSISYIGRASLEIWAVHVLDVYYIDKLKNVGSICTFAIIRIIIDLFLGTIIHKVVSMRKGREAN